MGDAGVGELAGAEADGGAFGGFGLGGFGDRQGFAAGKVNVHAVEDWEPLDEASRQRIWEVYLDKIQGVCQAGYCDFIAHLDLPKKFGALLPDALKPKMEQLLQAISQSGVAMEVNTAGLDKPCQEWYPSEEILHRAVALGIPLLVNADAHATSQVVRHFSEARAALRAAAITQVCEFTEHRRRMIPLD